MLIMKNRTNQGFTLMEIMVVIIVIAVLASVAGPMIGSITDQGKASATKASMQNVKTALVNFNNDLGKFPFTGTNGSVQTAHGTGCQAILLGTTYDLNVLVSNTVTTGYCYLGICEATYQKRWKGPYMDADPNEFMNDAWMGPLLYQYDSKALYLHSAGPDGVYENKPTDVSNGAYQGDDIVMSVSKVRF